ncbi:hypothetical protein Tco_0237935 [Tanacetum coccineum]
MQNGSFIADYCHKLNALWKPFDAMIEWPKCVCNASEGFKKHNQLMKLTQFLMGLDDSYMQIRSTILSREVLPDVKSAYATISSEDSHRVDAGSIAGANQRMTYNDKELDNILDISHLKIKVGHPNGTKAFISKIENLKLSNGLILYDVFVIPEYCVTLISVHKLAKENKNVVAFDEKKCDFLNQDLSLRSVMGTGSQCEGLGHPTYSVLNVLKKSLQIDNNEKNLCCDVCQRAKQTREPFPLSAHIPNDDERVDPKLNSDNKSQSDSSSFSESGRNCFTANLSVNFENDVDSSDNILATQDERVTTLEENIFSEEQISNSKPLGYLNYTCQIMRNQYLNLCRTVEILAGGCALVQWKLETCRAPPEDDAAHNSSKPSNQAISIAKLSRLKES